MDVAGALKKWPWRHESGTYAVIASYQSDPVEALDRGEEPEASGDEPGDGCFCVRARINSSADTLTLE